MTVRNEQKLAFRDLTPEERSEIVEAWLASGIEVWTGYAWTSHQGNVYQLYDMHIYRTRPRQLVIPWNVIKPEYKWAAIMEEGAAVWLFEQKPEINGGDNYWSCGGDFCRSALNIDTAGIDFRESLTERPEGV